MSAAEWKILLADGILVIHFGIVAFIVLGLPLIWIGHFLKWSFVRNLWFRVTHLALMSIVAIQALFGIICPLTTLENKLRESAGAAAYESTFIDHWLSQLMFFEFSPVFFTVAYTLFFLLIAASWIVVPPDKRRLVEENSST